VTAAATPDTPRARMARKLEAVRDEDDRSLAIVQLPKILRCLGYASGTATRAQH
jgi:hypothetical protein